MSSVSYVIVKQSERCINVEAPNVKMIFDQYIRISIYSPLQTTTPSKLLMALAPFSSNTPINLSHSPLSLSSALIA